MYASVTIETNVTDLSKEVWNFVLIGTSLELKKYEIFERASKRSSWKCVKKFDILLKENSIKLVDIPFTDEVKDLALSELVSQITVTIDFK